MENKAARRIKGGIRATGPADRQRSRFLQFFVVSLLVHGVVLAAIWQYSGPEKPKKVVELINVSVMPLPGPAGGGGKSEEIKEPPKEPPQKEEVPEKEPVKVQARLEEKPKPEPGKPEPDKVEAPKPRQEMPAGPGQGPVGGGGKKVDDALTGPIAVEGGITFPELQRYLKRLQGQVDRRWHNANTVSFAGKRVQPKAVLYFSIDRNGKINELKVDKTSGNISYDNSAIGVIRDIQKNGFDRLPPGFKGDSLGIYYTFMMEQK